MAAVPAVPHLQRAQSCPTGELDGSQSPRYRVKAPEGGCAMLSRSTGMDSSSPHQGVCLHAAGMVVCGLSLKGGPKTLTQGGSRKDSAWVITTPSLGWGQRLSQTLLGQGEGPTQGRTCQLGAGKSWGLAMPSVVWNVWLCESWGRGRVYRKDR